MHAVTRALPSGRLRLFCIAAAGIDGAFYLTLTGVPYKAMRLGAAPLILGLLPAVWSVIYITGCGLAGRLSDHIPRVRMARVGTLILLLAIGALWATPILAGLFAGLALAAIGLSMFWPALQAAIAETGDPSRLDRELGWFNISWSGGKSVGFLVGGLILATFGFGALFGVSLSVVALVSLVLFTARPGERAALRSGNAAFGLPTRGAGEVAFAPAPAADAVARDTASGTFAVAGAPGPSPGLSSGRRQAFLLLAWVANGASYGAASSLNYHYPRLLGDLGLGSDLFGAFLGLVYLSQTLSFLVLMRTSRWHYRRLPLYLAQAGLVTLLFVLPAVHVPLFVLLLAPLAGVELGLAYFSSIYYSLHVAKKPGRNTGYHEAVIGSGTLLVPPIGGWLATRLGGSGVPFLFCAAVVIVAIAVEETIIRTSGRDPNHGRKAD